MTAQSDRSKSDDAGALTLTTFASRSQAAPKSSAKSLKFLKPKLLKFNLNIAKF
jgi:hypothetical protein